MDNQRPAQNPPYCTNPATPCSQCALSSYGRDCQGRPIYVYTLTPAEHAVWYGAQAGHDELHERLRDTLPSGTEVYDDEGIIVDVTAGRC